MEFLFVWLPLKSPSVAVASLTLTVLFGGQIYSKASTQIIYSNLDFEP